MVGILIRFLYLDADPYYYEWSGYITDEGRWVQAARSFALSHCEMNFMWILHLALAPVFQFINFVVFKLGGVSILTARILTALSGSAIIVVFWAVLRHRVTSQALLLGLILLCFQPDLVMLSRVAVPEMAAMFFQLIIFFVVASKSGSRPWLLFAGLLLLIAVGIKATVVPLLAIFSVVILFMPRADSIRETGKEKWSDLVSFWTGFTVPLVATLLVLSSCGIIEKTPHLFSIFRTLKSFVRMSPHVLRIHFDSPFSLTLNTWGLGLWLTLLAWTALAWTASGRHGTDWQSRRYLGASTIWTILYYAISTLLHYFPTRWRVHILIPMAVSITVGTSVIQRMTIRQLRDSFVNDSRALQLLRLAVLGLPTAAFLSPLLASAFGMFVVNPGRLRIKLACLTISVIVITGLISQLKRRMQAIAFFLCFPLVAALIWLMLRTVWPGSYAFWPSEAAQFHAISWSFFLLGAAGVYACLAKTGDYWKRTISSRLVVTIAICYMMISLVAIAPGYTDPHYSMRDTSRDLGVLLSGFQGIASYKAEGLFNGNSLRYESLAALTLPRDSRPEIIVVAFLRPSLEVLLEQEYGVLKSYNLYVSPVFYRLHPTFTERYPGKLLRVYKKNGVN